MQRGASNLYFPVIHSALSIPPWADTLQQMLGTMWGPLVATPADERAAQIEWLKKTGPLAHISLSTAELAAAIENRVEALTASSENLRVDEYARFTSQPEGFESTDDFELRAEPLPTGQKEWFEAIRRAVRLREVRAISGFTRIDPPGRDDDDSTGIQKIAPIYETKQNWLPAIEVRGEGIFIAFSRKRLAEWSLWKGVQTRVEILDVKFRKAFQERYDREPKRRITPALVMIHTFAHALMRQLGLECGYSGTSLRERLYIDSELRMHGVLIYTATSDADGTLGGLARQGSPDLLGPSIRAAIGSIRWCSSDPLCIEGLAALSEATNGSACHACVLVPETSCEEFNGLLDRALLVGTPQDSKLGYFTGLLEE